MAICSYVSSAGSVVLVTLKKVRILFEFTNEAMVRGYFVLCVKCCVGNEST